MPIVKIKTRKERLDILKEANEATINALLKTLEAELDKKQKVKFNIEKYPSKIIDIVIQKYIEAGYASYTFNNVLVIIL